MDVEIEHDDLNQKFLTNLASEWLMHTIVWRNRSDLNTISLDDLYNHLKVYEFEVQKKSEPNSQNMAFISLAKHSRGNEEVNTASDWSYMANDEENHALIADEETPTEFALMAKTSGESEVFDNSLCSKACFQTALKDLDSLLESQILDKNKEGLGYSVVYPPPAQIYSPPKKDMSWIGLPECTDDTVTDYSRPTPTIES
nr:ribonuclease H-like domain-containing protein [Tanacetum cinerariifolium]